MPASTAPILKLVRRVMGERGLTVPALAERAGVDRARLRRALSDQEPITLLDFLAIAEVLELHPEAYAAAPELSDTPPADAPQAEPKLTALGRNDRAPRAEAQVFEPWGGHAEQLVKAAFALGCDFLFTTKIDALGSSGVPAAVLAQYKNGILPIRLDAAYHRYNAPRYDDSGVTLTLSFDALYDCRFPYVAFQQVIFFPEAATAAPAPESPPPEEGRPTLRLVR